MWVLMRLPASYVHPTGGTLEAVVGCMHPGVSEEPGHAKDDNVAHAHWTKLSSGDQCNVTSASFAHTLSSAKHEAHPGLVCAGCEPGDQPHPRGGHALRRGSSEPSSARGGPTQLGPCQLEWRRCL